MGTVGLSFGSPTSGAGFDVSATVSSIVANLQNVETPWKTQLTTLESQDTAISSLGTLLSNLSNDMTSLTDFEGIMAEKTGSSSNEDVLTLTAATSSAAAGTHTVLVNSLAQTSSGYLAEIANASAAIVGSITLKVGSGTAMQIGVPTSNNTLAGLASAINSSGVGVTASVLTDSTGSRLSLVSGTSGAGGNITISGNSIATAQSTTLSYTGTAGSSTVTSAGTLSPVASLSDTLTGSISIQVGGGTAQNVSLGTSGGTLQDLADAIDNTSGTGVTASIVTNNDGTSSLSLASLTAGSAGTLTVTSSISDPSTALNYTSAVAGANASLTVDGVSLTSASNTVANLIPGVTFQLLSASSTPIQVVIGNDNTAVESTLSSMVSDYNSLVSALNAQEGNDSSGSPEPLFGSPTLSLLQQQLMNSLNTQNPNGTLDPISTDDGTTLSGSISISWPDGRPLFFSGATASSTGASSGTLTTIPSASDTLSGSISIQVGSGAAQTITVDSSSDTLATLANAINNTSGIGATAAVVTNSDGSSYLSLTSLTPGNNGALTVDSSIADTNAQKISLSSTDDTLSGLASAINSGNFGATANVLTSHGESTLNLYSQISGTMTVTSAITASSATPLSYSGSAGTDGSDSASATTSTGALSELTNEDDTLSGSISIQVGSGASQSVSLGSSGGTLQDLADAINNISGIGVQAAVVQNSDKTYSLQLTSGTPGSTGTLSVTSNILDISNTTQSALKYSNSSDINSLTALGISVNNDGSISFDAESLDSVLNTDYSSVVGFFQGSNGWGQTFGNMLTNAGTSSSTGILSLASSSNSNTESTLNAEISKEQALISTQQTSLTAELNSANEIMQELPSQLQGVNELYSAITGYNQGTNG